jgi:hypothetical protein
MGAYLSCFGIVMIISLKNIIDIFLAFGGKSHMKKTKMKV